MDRFIDCVKSDLQYDLMNLKSNMDRFIVQKDAHTITNLTI